MTVKQVIVLRKDLNMRKGKMIAQGAHASLLAIMSGAPIFEGKVELRLDSCLSDWLSGDYKKIAVGVDGEEELLGIYESAVKSGLRCSLVLDHGLTEFGGKETYTACAIGPSLPELVDKITGHLKLL